MRFSVILIICLLSVTNINSTEMLNCALGLVEEKQCPVDGGWTLWSTWSNCEGQCSSVGRQVRTRNCSNPQPSNNGLDCVGNQFEVKGCGVPGCSYEEYEKLFAQDGNRLQQLKALKQASGSQNALLTKCLLSHCSFETISQTLGESGSRFWSSLQCVKKHTGCPVAGGWGAWSEWSRCSSLCGQGEQFRCHVCCNPPPTSAHTSCHGESCEFKSCTGTQCGQPQKQEGEWSNWSQWSACNAPCRLGITRRSRTCKQQDQKKAKKSVHQETKNEELKSFDFMDYYDDYFDGSYGQDKESYVYKEKGFVEIDQPSILKKRHGEKCDSKIEYYSTEDYEDVITLSKTLSGASTLEINQHLNTTTSVEHLLGLYPSTKSVEVKSENSYPHTVTEHSNPRILEVDSEQSYPHTVEAKSTYSYPQTVSEYSYSQTVPEHTLLVNTIPEHTVQVKSTQNSPQTVPEPSYTLTVDVKPEYTSVHNGKVKKTTKLLGNLQSQIIEHSHRACSEPLSAKSTKPSKKPHTKGKGKSVKNNVGCKITTELSISTNSQTDIPVKTCNSEHFSTEDKYQTESSINLKTTTTESNECTGELHKEKEEEISIFGNLVINEKHAKGKQKSDEINTDGTESIVNERKTDESKNFIWTQDNSKTTCITIKPEDDILNLGKESVLTVQPKISLSQTLRFSITDKTESLKSSTSSSFIFRNDSKNDLSNSNWPTVTSLSTTSFENNYINSSPVEKTTTDEDLDFDNTSDVSNQRSCDIRKLLQLPSYNNSFVVNDCKGSFEEIKSCNTKPCSEEGGWSSWSAWSPCSKECGLGKQVSTRSCTQPEPTNNGSSCKGETAQKRSCYEQSCPVKVSTPRAMLMSGDSYIEYDILHEHSSVFLLYLRFQHFNCSGSFIVRESWPNCENHLKCDIIHISLYNCYILLVVKKETCSTNLLSSVQLSIGDWHEALITIVGVAVTMRLDNNFLTQSANLSCRPLAPNFDSKMKLGGNFIGEIDRLRINFKNYHFQKKNSKREILFRSEEHVEPEEVSQVQFSLNKEESTKLSLALFLHAPCFANESSWKIEVALKPEFSEGLLLFFHGYNQGEFVIVTLEHSRVRLQVKVSSETGACEQPSEIAPHSWIHVSVSKPSAGPVGLAVNGGDRCVVSFLASSIDNEEPSIRCTAGIFLGEVPTSIKGVLVNRIGEVSSLNSPLGLLGSLTVDNHTLDLSQLPHKITSDVTFNHSTTKYKFSSNMVSETVHYEEMLILEGEPFSLVCLYDLSSEQNLNSSNTSGQKLNLKEHSATWIKLDLPVETAFEISKSNITYSITDSGKSTSIIIIHYSDYKIIEGFYSCWLQYPLPLQPGLNIITYSVVVITDHQNVSWSTTIYKISKIIFVFILLLVCVLWIIIEAILNFKTGSGIYRFKKIGFDKTLERMRSVIISKQGAKLLGSAEAANESYQRYLAQMDADMLATVFDKDKNENELKPLLDNASDDDGSRNDVKIRIPDKNRLKEKEIKQLKNSTVGYVFKEHHLNPFFTNDENCHAIEKPSHLRVMQGEVFDESGVFIDDLQRSEVEDDLGEDESGGAEEIATLRNYSIINSAGLKKKDVGLIQETTAYKSIENELKFKPVKHKSFGKYNYINKGNK